jgi:hypothetical protein
MVLHESIAISSNSLSSEHVFSQNEARFIQNLKSVPKAKAFSVTERRQT